MTDMSSHLAPAETPFSMLAMAELCERAGIPAGVVNVITTDSGTKDVGKEICENSHVKKVTFTGSTGVGKILMSQSASTLKKLSFELGGNAPFIGEQLCVESRIGRLITLQRQSLRTPTWMQLSKGPLPASSARLARLVSVRTGTRLRNLRPSILTPFIAQAIRTFINL